MSRVVLLDAGLIGLLTNPKQSAESTACLRWLQGLVSSDSRVIVPEIADYEVRREGLLARTVVLLCQKLLIMKSGGNC